jgi:hypothetical protein
MKIFISYRRLDTAPWAGRIYERLVKECAGDNIFMDVESMRPGDRISGALTQVVADADAVLVLIGDKWLHGRDGDRGPRLWESEDLVRREVEAALQYEKRIIPVLINGAAMPGADQLPPSIVPLADRNAMRVSHEQFPLDTDALIAALGECKRGRRFRHDLALKIRSLVRGGGTSLMIPVVAFGAPALLARVVIDVVEPSQEGALLLSSVFFMSAALLSLFALIARRRVSLPLLAVLSFATIVWTCCGTWFLLIATRLTEWKLLVVPSVGLAVLVAYLVLLVRRGGVVQMKRGGD